jgi:hypothetical protein
MEQKIYQIDDIKEMLRPIFEEPLCIARYCLGLTQKVTQQRIVY